MNQQELNRLKKNFDTAISNINARIDNLTIETILDRHIGLFINKLNTCSEKIKNIKEENEVLRKEKLEIDNAKEKNKELQSQIENIKAKMLSIDVKNIADTQRYIESLKQDTIYINKDKYTNITDNILSLETKELEVQKEIAMYEDKLVKFNKAKQVLGLSE